MNAYLHIMNGMDYHSDDYRFHMGEDGQVYHCAGREDYTEDYFKLEHPEKIHPECVRRAAEKAWEAMRATLLPDDRVLMDGTDSTTAQPQLMELIQELNRQFEDIDFQSASLEEYVAVLKEKLSLDELPEISGELRDGPTTSLSGNALMTRPHLKALNKKLQNTLFGGARTFFLRRPAFRRGVRQRLSGYRRPLYAAIPRTRFHQRRDAGQNGWRTCFTV